MSPAAQLPVLRDGDVAVTGAFAIPEYLEETYPEIPLWPADPAERREARRLLDWFLTVFQAQVTDGLLFQKVNPRYGGVARPPAAPAPTCRRSAPASRRCAPSST